MTTGLRRAWYLLGCSTALVGALGTPCAWAETPGELPKAGTYEGSMKLQQQYDQQQQQGREQQQQQQQQRDQQWQSTVQQQQAQQNAAVAQGQAVLRAWQKRPALAAEHNPLLGRWSSQGSTTGATKKLAGGNDLAKLLGPEMASLTNSMLGGLTQGMCDSMLGRGLIEFRPTAVVAIGRDGREHIKYHVQYRGGGSRVVVLPQDAASFTHMIVDFDSADHATVAAVGCVMVRAGSAGAADAGAPAGGATTVSTTPAGATPSGANAAGPAVLTLRAGATEAAGQFTPAAGRDVWVMKGSADTALIRGGLQSSPEGNVMHNFMVACQQRTPTCQQGLRAIQASTVSLVKTDAGGRAQTQTLPAGRYYVFGTLVFNQRPMVWQVPIDLRAGSNALALDLANASPVD
jgi:hypothetical protein